MVSKLSLHDIKKLKIEAVKLKFKHSILNVYKKILDNIIMSNKEWISILQNLLVKNNNVLNTNYVNEMLLIDENINNKQENNYKDKEIVCNQVLSMVHQTIIYEFLFFLSNENRKFKRFINKSISETNSNIKNLFNKLKLNNIDTTYIENSIHLIDNNLLNIEISFNKSKSDGDHRSENIKNNQNSKDNVQTYYYVINNDNDYENFIEDIGHIVNNYDEGYDNYDYDGNDYDGNDGDYDNYDGGNNNDLNVNRDKKNKDKLEKKFKELIKVRQKKNTDAISDFKKLPENEKIMVIDDLSKINDNNTYIKNLTMRVLKSKMTLEEKQELLTKIETYDSGGKGKFIEYCETVLSFPFKQYSKMNIDNLNNEEEINNLLDSAKKTLDKSVYGHEEAKHSILCHISQMISNPESIGKAIGLSGAKGTGKTSLVKDGFCKILGLPFILVGLAGLTDGTFFTGHNYTYEGSQPGEIVKSLKQAKCLNPVIFCDELDKISTTRHGKEISNKLIQLIDPVQNMHFKDSYFGNINIDLSKAIWIFTWNDTSMIDPILLDRIKVIKIKGFNFTQKVKISYEYLIPSVIKEIGFKHNVNIDDEVIKYIINGLTFEGGVRKLRELLFEIVSELNMKCLTGEIKIKRKRNLDGSSKFIYNITMNNINDFLIKKIPYEHVKIRNKPTIGHISGLFATDNDVGGIVPITATFTVSNELLSLNLTGKLGKVAKESAIVAKSVAWNKTSDNIKEIFIQKWKDKKEGIHIHCQDLSTGLEGPSATTAIALCLYSLFNNIPINNEIGITGEMDLSGNVMKIGGLQQKMYGAKFAGCKIVLFPKENIKSYETIITECPDLIDDNFKAYPISTFDEALNFCLVSPVNKF